MNILYSMCNRRAAAAAAGRDSCDHGTIHGMGRSRGHVVRGRAWGKAAVGRPEQPAMESKDMIRMAGDTYGLR